MKSIGFGNLTSYLGTGFGFNQIIELPANKNRGVITNICAGYTNSSFISNNGFGRLLIVGETGIDENIPFDPAFPIPLSTIGAEMFKSQILFDYTITFRSNDFNSVNLNFYDGFRLNESKSYSVILTYYNDYSGFFPPAPPVIANLNVRGYYDSMKNPFGELR